MTTQRWATPPPNFPDRCECTLSHERVLCAKNETDCQIAWVVADRLGRQPTWLERMLGPLFALAWWRR